MFVVFSIPGKIIATIVKHGISLCIAYQRLLSQSAVATDSILCECSRAKPVCLGGIRPLGATTCLNITTVYQILCSGT